MLFLDLNPESNIGYRDTSTPLLKYLAALLLTLVFCLVVYWPFLGWSGLSQSEGHRAIPGWGILHDGNWLVTSMFEHSYLRKPPGMPWAIAVFSSVLGETEFAARSVSAAATTLSALLICLVGCRWFGPLAGAVAGVGLALMPTLWYPGRSSEIEALHNLCALGVVLGFLSLGLSGHRFKAAVAVAIATGLSVTGMILCKGPAGVPCLLGAILAVWLVRRNWGGLATPVIFIPFLIPLALVATYAFLALQSFEDQQATAIIESPGRFLWNEAHIHKILLLPIMSFLSAFPAGVGLLCAWGGAPLKPKSEQYAKGIILACILAVLIYACAGVSNTRYVMPALLIAPMGWSIVLTRVRQGLAQAPSSKTAKTTIRSLVIGALILLCAAWAHAYWLEHRREYRTSGKPMGLALGEMVNDGTEIWAFEMIDQRPELLYYARRRAAELGKTVRVRWMPMADALSGPEHLIKNRPLLPPSGSYIVIRDDDKVRDQYAPEMGTFVREGVLEKLKTPILTGKVHNFSFRVYQVP